jgi:hypothetical protein
MNPPGFGPGWTKLRGDQGYRDPHGNIWRSTNSTAIIGISLIAAVGRYAKYVSMARSYGRPGRSTEASDEEVTSIQGA